MPDTLGRTKVSTYEVLSDEQLLGIAEMAAKKGDKRIFAESAQELKNRGGAGYLKLNTSSQLGVPASSIDVESGMKSGLRAKLSFSPTEKERFKLAEKLLSDGQVRALETPIGVQYFYNNPEFNSGKWTMVEGYGLDAGDFADLLGEAPSTVAAAAAGIATAAMSPFVQAASATIAASWVRGIQDAAFRKAYGEDVNMGEIVSRRAAQAPVEFVLDYAGLKVMGGVSRILKGGKGATPSDPGDIMQSMSKSIDDLEARFNISIDKTAGMRSSEKLAARESVIAENIPEGKLARRLASVRDQIEDMRLAMEGKPTANLRESVNRLRRRLQADIKAMRSEVDESAAQTFAEWERSINQRLESLGRRAGHSLYEGGRAARQSIEDARDMAMRKSSEAYRALDDSMDANNIHFDSQVVAAKLRKLVADSGLPTDEKGAVLNEFLTPQMRELGRKASGLDNPTALEIIDAFISKTDATKTSPLSYRQIRQWRSDVGSRIDWNDTSIKTKDSRRLYSALGDMLEEAEGRAPARVQPMIQEAKDIFTNEVLPFRDGALSKVLSKGAKEYKVRNEAVLGELLSVSELKRIKKIFGINHPVFGDIKALYLDRLIGDASNLSDGLVDVRMIAPGKADREVVMELFGPNGTRTLDELRQMTRMKGVGDPSAVIDPDDLRAMFGARIPSDVTKIASLAKKQMARKASMDKALSQKLVRDLADNKIPMGDEYRVVEALLSKSTDTNTVNRVMRNMGADDKQALKVAMFGELLHRAGQGQSKAGRLTAKHGRRFLWDTKELDDLLNKPATRQRIRQVLGEDDVKTMQDLNNLLKAVEAREDKPLDPLAGRVLTMADEKGGVNVFAALYNLPRWAWNKTLSGAYGSGALTRLLSETKDAEEFFKAVVPYTLSTTEGLRAIATEGEKDPAYGRLMNSLLAPEKKPADSSATQEKAPAR